MAQTSERTDRMNTYEKFYVVQADCICREYFAHKGNQGNKMKDASTKLKLGRKKECPDDAERPDCPIE